ncbi:hypothetical protein [Paenibacillus thalictri]|nr:hypothetical protein [Paenibacillus thalictri]
MGSGKANRSNNPNFKENKFTEDEAAMHAEKAAKRPASLNEVPKQTNPQ